jgi:hypothetical protein
MQNGRNLPFPAIETRRPQSKKQAKIPAKPMGQDCSNRRQLSRFPIFVGGDKSQRRFGHLDRFDLQAVAFCVDFDVHGNRGVADLDDVGVKRQQVAHEYRMFK